MALQPMSGKGFLDDVSAGLQQPPAEPVIVVAAEAPEPKSETRLESQISTARSQGTDVSYAADGYLKAVSEGIQVQKKEAKTQVALAEGNAATVGMNSDRVMQEAELAMSRVTEGMLDRNTMKNRQAEIKQANPLVRGIKSLFDRSWNLDTLRKAEREAEGNIDLAIKDANRIAAISDMHSDASTRKTGVNSFASTARGAQAETGMSTALTTFQALNQQWGVSRDQIRETVAGEQARMTAGDIALAALDEGQVGGLLQEAMQTGSVVVGDTRITTGQLQDRYRAIQQRAAALQAQQLGLQSQRMGLQSQRMGMEQQIKGQVLETMNRAELETAIANGGAFAGVQFGLPELAARLEGVVTGTQYAAGLQVGAQSATTAFEGLAAAGNYGAQMIRRGIEAFGQGRVPPSVQAANNAFATKIATLNERIQWAKDNPQDPRAPAMYETAIAESQKALEQLYKSNEAAVKATGGTPEKQATMAATIMGTAVDPATATTAMTQWAKAGAIPAFLNTNPRTRRTNELMQTRIANLQASPEYRAATEAGKTAMEQTVVRNSINEGFVGTTSEDTMLALPQILERGGVNLGISPMDWADARVSARNAAINGTAKQLGVDTALLNHALSTNDWSKLPGVDRVKAGQLVRAGTDPAFLERLDVIKPGASRAVVEAMRVPQNRALVTRAARGLAGDDAGADVMNIVTGGRVDGMGVGIGEALSIAGQANRQAALTASVTAAQAFGTNPVKRSRAQIAAIPDSLLPPAEKSALTAYINQRWKADAQRPSGVGFSVPVVGGLVDPLINPYGESNEVVGQAILRDLEVSRFDDPQLESARKGYLKHYQSHKDVVDKMLSVFRESE